MYENTECVTCGAVLVELRNGPKEQCPKCGGISRKYLEVFGDNITIHEHLRLRGKHGDKGKPFFDQQIGSSFYYKTQEWHYLERLIDRDNDLYVEKLTNLRTGETVKEVSEPLSQHIGHGSAKHKKRDSS